ncbi:MAG: hypothetical protein K8R86_12325 [Bacteroidales bacterium]|nr:hypothetical protein [Bacteroidales bacterium]
MKKFLFLLLLVLLFKLPISAQTPFWEEDFSTGQGWTVEPNWTITGSMLEFYWSPSITNFDASAISPVIGLHESIGEMIVTQYLDVFSTMSDEKADISIIHENGEDILWSYAISNGNWGATGGTEIEFSLEPYAGQDVQFRFRTYGNDTYNWNWWDVHNIMLTVYLDNDLAVSEISGPTQIELMESGIWDVVVKNTGLNSIADYTVKLFDHKTGDLIGSIDDPDELEPQSTKSYSFEWFSAAAYNTAFYGFVMFEGDEFEGNNVSKSHFVRINPDIDFSILVWDNDNDIETIICPVQGDEIQPSTALKRVLDEAGFEYNVAYFLPDDLDTYDMVFSTMGCFCVS